MADEKLGQFLREIQDESKNEKREIELIINGDFFEFLQVPAVEQFDPHTQYPREAFLDSSEPASIKRLNLIAEGHPELFNALSDFMHVEKPQRRITMIKGNHDVHLFWPGVKSRLRELLGASGSRASLLLFAQEFVSREKIYVEHGHQRTERINSYDDFHDPRLPHNLSQLHYPPGSCFFVNFLNKMKHRYWFIDHIKPLTALIWYSLPWDFDFAAETLACFIRQTSTPSPEQLLADLDNQETRRYMAHLYAFDPDFRGQFHHQIQPYLNDYPLLDEEDPVTIGRAERAHQRATLRRAAEAIAGQEGTQVVLFGHTHQPTEELLSNGTLYINTGCWIEDFSDATAETWQALFGNSRSYCQIPSRLPYARIDYDAENNPTAKLLYMTADTDPPPASSEAKRPAFKTSSLLTKIFGI